MGLFEARRRGVGAAKKAIHGANLRHKVPGLKAQALAERCPGETLSFLEVQGIENGARGRNKYRSARCSKGRLGLQIHGPGAGQGQAYGHVDELTHGLKTMTSQRSCQSLEALKGEERRRPARHPRRHHPASGAPVDAHGGGAH